MRTRSALLLAGGVGYSLIAASTTPFTLPADALTGAAIVAMAVVVCMRWPLRSRSLSSSAPNSASVPGAGHLYLPWLALVIVFVVWELFNYLVHGTRADRPTFSSITDAIDRTYLLKTLLFLGWLAGARVIVRRGSRAQRRKTLGRARPAGPAGAAGPTDPVQP
jgi:hypothetical protein